MDVAIRVGPLNDASLVAVPLGQVRRIIVASPAYLKGHGKPRRVEDLVAHNCLLLRGFSRLAQWPMYVGGERVLIPVQGSISSDSADVLLELAIAGVGIVRLGDFWAGLHSQPGDWSRCSKAAMTTIRSRLWRCCHPAGRTFPGCAPSSSFFKTSSASADPFEVLKPGRIRSRLVPV
ncbi:substrate binding domain-containing protein [Bradyrhizobium sp. TZ2]